MSKVDILHHNRSRSNDRHMLDSLLCRLQSDVLALVLYILPCHHYTLWTSNAQAQQMLSIGSVQSK